MVDGLYLCMKTKKIFFVCFLLTFLVGVGCTPKIGKKAEGCNTHLVRVKHKKPSKAYEARRKARLELSKRERVWSQ